MNLILGTFDTITDKNKIYALKIKQKPEFLKYDWPYWSNPLNI